MQRHIEATKIAPIIKSRALLAAKRRSALLTLYLPIAGTVVGAISTYVTGFSRVEMATFLVMFLWAGLGLEVGFHRLFAHKAFQTFEGAEIFWWLSGLTAAQGVGTHWVASHRSHHSHSDTPDDPHSPYYQYTDRGYEDLRGIKGLWHAHQGHTYTSYATNVQRYAPDLVRSELFRKLDNYYLYCVLFGLLLPACIGAVAFGSIEGAWRCFLWGGPIRIFVQHQSYFLAASVGHSFGEKVFDTGDNSRNNFWCALLSLGGTLQNTHHAFAASPFLKYRWYEIDLAGFVIRSMEMVGLARGIRRPSKRHLDEKKIARVQHNSKRNSLIYRNDTKL